MSENEPPQPADEKPVTCPKCGSVRVSQILYGFPNYANPEVARKLNDGAYSLGGCVFSVDDPRWKCRDCRNLW